MSVVPTFDDYRDKYSCFKLERDDDGILLVTMHTEGKELVWGFGPDEQAGFLFQDIASDVENKAVILTGEGDAFIAYEEFAGAGEPVPIEIWVNVMSFAKRLLNGHLSIEVPMIAAVNGPALLHAELAFLCNIVLASETAEFADEPHFPNGLVPGDGVQIIWPALLGHVRAQYLLLTGRHLSAQEALELGLVNEVLPGDQLLPRAYELARNILKRPPVTVRLTRQLFTQQWRNLLHDNLAYGLGLEGMGAAAHWPTEFKRDDYSG